VIEAYCNLIRKNHELTAINTNFTFVVLNSEPLASFVSRLKLDLKYVTYCDNRGLPFLTQRPGLWSRISVYERHVLVLSPVSIHTC
jgi:hypothetical protein